MAQEKVRKKMPGNINRSNAATGECEGPHAWCLHPWCRSLVSYAPLRADRQEPGPVVKQGGRDPQQEILDNIKREIEETSPDDYGKIAELHQALDGIDREIELRKGKAPADKVSAQRNQLRKALALHILRTSEFLESKRPEWAKSSYPPQPPTETDAEIRVPKQEVANLKAEVKTPAEAAGVGDARTGPAQTEGERKALETPVPSLPIGFRHSPDYRSVSLREDCYSLTERQAQVIAILHKAYANGTPDLGSALILERLETRNSRLRDTFKTNQPAWRALIASGKRRGTLRLNL